MIISITIRFLVSLGFLLSISGQEIKSNCSRMHFDESLSKMIGIFGVKTVKFPANDKEMDAFCNLSVINTKFTKNFIDDCLKGYSKTVMFIFDNNLKVFLKQFCGDDKSERKNFINWAKCGNMAKNKTGKCWNRLITNLWISKRIEESQDRIPAMCCNFLTWKSCTMNAYKAIGSPTCSAEAIEGYDTQINKSTLDVLQVLCDEYFEEPAQCNELVNSLPPHRKGKKRRIINRTPFLALFKIFESLH